ncbi:hypothetical protein NL676_028749 [Syzygium grande]|nr:hypothetical protein NL676_028749 [Syzygium grande]
MPVNPWTPFTSLCFFSFLLLVMPFLRLASAVNSQGQALLSWKTSLNGSLEALSDWNWADEILCRWFGVTCNSNDGVAELSLRYVDMLGYVPTNLSLLHSLQKLVLSETNLTGSIPKEIGSLPS